MQTDPIGYEDQVNLYAYVGNDPVNGMDPTGEKGTWKDTVCAVLLLCGKAEPKVDKPGDRPKSGQIERKPIRGTTKPSPKIPENKPQTRGTTPGSKPPVLPPVPTPKSPPKQVGIIEGIIDIILRFPVIYIPMPPPVDCSKGCTA